MKTDEMKKELTLKAQNGSAAMTAAPTGKDDFDKIIAKYLDGMKGQIALALPKHITADRIARIALTTIRMNPDLKQCSIPSILGGIMLSSQLGLELGPLGQSYLIPKWSKKTNHKEAVFMIGYTGYLALTRRSGEIRNLNARIVYSNDKFGSKEECLGKIKFSIGDPQDENFHIPWYSRKAEGITESGNVEGVYLDVKYQNGGGFFDYMDIVEIEKHRARSDSKDKGPWITDYEAMMKKTIIRKNWRWLPLSIEVMKAGDTEGFVNKNVNENMIDNPDDIIDIQPEDYNNKIEDIQEIADEQVKIIDQIKESEKKIEAELAKKK